MSEWFTVAELSKKTNIPQQTLRRYMQIHNHLLRMKKEHKSYQIHQESVEVLRKIRELYKKGKTQEEVDEILTNSGIPLTIDVVDESGEQVSVSATEKLDEIMQALEDQKKFNESLVGMLKAQAKQMEDQQKYFAETLKHRDEMLIESFRELQESKQQLEISHEHERVDERESEEKPEPEPEKKSWFKRLFK